MPHKWHIYEWIHAITLDAVYLNAYKCALFYRISGVYLNGYTQSLLNRVYLNGYECVPSIEHVLWNKAHLASPSANGVFVFRT